MPRQLSVDLDIELHGVPASLFFHHHTSIPRSPLQHSLITRHSFGRRCFRNTTISPARHFSHSSFSLEHISRYSTSRQSFASDCLSISGLASMQVQRPFRRPGNSITELPMPCRWKTSYSSCTVASYVQTCFAIVSSHSLQPQ